MWPLRSAITFATLSLVFAGGGVLSGCAPDAEDPPVVECGPVSGFRRIASSSESGFPEYEHIATGVRMVRLPGGRIRLGALEPNGPPMYPPRTVEIDPFLIAKYELSRAEWNRVYDATVPYREWHRLPQTGLSYDDCADYCDRTGLAFPHPDEWEYACRGGSETPFYFGTKLQRDLANVCAHDDARPVVTGYRVHERVRDADAYPPNGFGLHHMHGNVAEWIDRAAHPYGAAHGSAEAGMAYLMGGSYLQLGPEPSWSYWREERRTDTRLDSLGFRPVFRLPK